MSILIKKLAFGHINESSYIRGRLKDALEETANCSIARNTSCVPEDDLAGKDQHESCTML